MQLWPCLTSSPEGGLLEEFSCRGKRKWRIGGPPAIPRNGGTHGGGPRIPARDAVVVYF